MRGVRGTLNWSVDIDFHVKALMYQTADANHRAGDRHASVENCAMFNIGRRFAEHMLVNVFDGMVCGLEGQTKA